MSVDPSRYLEVANGVTVGDVKDAIAKLAKTESAGGWCVECRAKLRLGEPHRLLCPVDVLQRAGLVDSKSAQKK